MCRFFGRCNQLAQAYLLKNTFHKELAAAIVIVFVLAVGIAFFAFYRGRTASAALNSTAPGTVLPFREFGGKIANSLLEIWHFVKTATDCCPANNDTFSPTRSAP